LTGRADFAGQKEHGSLPQALAHVANGALALTCQLSRRILFQSSGHGASVQTVAR
jgi:hypothetical protein